MIIPAYKLWVICSHARYSSFSADLDNIYTDEAEAKAEATKLNEMVVFGRLVADDCKYYVRSLDDAFCDAKENARDEGAMDERDRNYG